MGLYSEFCNHLFLNFNSQHWSLLIYNDAFLHDQIKQNQSLKSSRYNLSILEHIKTTLSMLYLTFRFFPFTIKCEKQLPYQMNNSSVVRKVIKQ